VDDGLLDMSGLVDRLSTTPAEILGIDAGHLSVDARADITIFDPNKHWVLNTSDMLSEGHNTPFENWEFKGEIFKTICNGQVVYSNEH
jgi:dihydroorotase